MPVYEYLCTNKHHFIKVEKMGASDVTSCPICDRPALRQMSKTSINVKGGTPKFHMSQDGKDENSI